MLLTLRMMAHIPSQIFDRRHVVTKAAIDGDEPLDDIEGLLLAQMIAAHSRGMGLIQKSLVVADLADEGTRYSLLTTTRLYALEKLRAAGEERHATERHDAYHRQMIGPGAAPGG